LTLGAKPDTKSLKRAFYLFHRGQMWGVLWFPFLGGLGAFIVESYVTVTKLDLTRGKGKRFSVTGIRYELKMVLGIFTGFVLAYVLQPSDITQAFLIGIGWEAVLSSMIKEANVVSVKDERVMRNLETTKLPGPKQSLKTAKGLMIKAGRLDRIPVVNKDRRLMGIVTDGMIEREVKKRDISASKIKLEEIMIGATDVIKVDEHDSVAKAIMMAEQQSPDEKIEGVAVIDHKGTVKGLLSMDQLKTLDRSLLSR